MPTSAIAHEFDLKVGRTNSESCLTLDGEEVPKVTRVALELDVKRFDRPPTLFIETLGPIHIHGEALIDAQNDAASRALQFVKSLQLIAEGDGEGHRVGKSFFSLSKEQEEELRIIGGIDRAQRR